MQPLFFEKGLSVSTDCYIHLTDTAMKSCMGVLLETNSISYQQNVITAKNTNNVHARTDESLMMVWP